MYIRKVANELFLPYLLLAHCTLFLVISAPSCVEFAGRNNKDKEWIYHLRLIFAVSLRALPWALVWSATLNYRSFPDSPSFLWFVILTMGLWFGFWFVGVPVLVVVLLFGGKDRGRAKLLTGLVSGLGAGFGSFTGLGSEHVGAVFEMLWTSPIAS